jgi:hypothetical protein
VVRLRTRWVPPDGVEPLNGNGHTPLGRDEEPETEASADGEPSSRRPAIDANDFWESGDTQEFVGVAVQDDDGLADSGTADTRVAGLVATTRRHPVGSNPALDDGTTPGWTARHGWPKMIAGAALALGLLAGGGIALATALQSASQPHRHAALTAAKDVGTHGNAGAANDQAILPAIRVHRATSRVAHRSRNSTQRRSRGRPAAATSAQAVRYVQSAPASSSSSESASQFASTGSSPPTGGGQTSPSTQSAQSQASQTPQPAHYGVDGPLVCVSNCGG